MKNRIEYFVDEFRGNTELEYLVESFGFTVKYVNFLEYAKNRYKINVTDLLYSGNQLLNFKINGCHNMYDLHKHLMGSLKSNCESFKIPKKYSKLDCDHREIQILYNDNKDNTATLIL